MTTRDEIIALAGEDKFCRTEYENYTHECYEFSAEELETFFHAAQKQAYERALSLTDDAWSIFGIGAQGPLGETLDAIEWYDSSIRALIEGESK